jgi:hypothetical protein
MSTPSSGTSNLIPANNLIADDATMGEAVTDGTVNGVKDIINTGGTNIADLAASTATNALDSL